MHYIFLANIWIQEKQKSSNVRSKQIGTFYQYPLPHVFAKTKYQPHRGIVNSDKTENSEIIMLLIYFILKYDQWENSLSRVFHLRSNIKSIEGLILSMRNISTIYLIKLNLH